ncbi:17977_t:CDS:2 [Entrophospora sp. SA101]|nr:17977_t:CDS:2 [Entrophospora sp. SA101]
MENISIEASFARANKSWLKTAKDPESRCYWLINRYGKAHSLFFAVYFGPSFISVDLVDCALKNDAILSRYFLQVLMKCYGEPDERLIELRSNYSNSNNLERHFEKLWGSDLPSDVYEKLLAEGKRRWNGEFYLKGSAQMTDAFESEETLRIVSRAIITHPELVEIWKGIGYESICYDYSDLVFQILYTEHPMLETILAKSQHFINLGFKLTKPAMVDIICSFKDRLNIIGEIIIKSFQKIRNKNKSTILEECLFEIIGGGGNLEQTTCVLDFLFQQIEGSPENIFLKILKHYGIGETSVANVNVDDENLEDLKLFSFDLCIYQWILKNFKPYPTIISKCFVEISLTKSYVDSLVLAGNAASSSSTSKLPHSIYTSFIKTYSSLYMLYMLLFELLFILF